MVSSMSEWKVIIHFRIPLRVVVFFFFSSYSFFLFQTAIKKKKGLFSQRGDHFSLLDVSFSQWWKTRRRSTNYFCERLTQKRGRRWKKKQSAKKDVSATTPCEKQPKIDRTDAIVSSSEGGKKILLFSLWLTASFLSSSIVYPLWACVNSCVSFFFSTPS